MYLFPLLSKCHRYDFFMVMAQHRLMDLFLNLFQNIGEPGRVSLYPFSCLHWRLAAKMREDVLIQGLRIGEFKECVSLYAVICYYRYT